MPWKKLSSKLIYKNKWIQLHEDQVIDPEGKKGIYSLVSTVDEVVYIAAFDDQKRICLTTAYRYPIQDTSIEMPAGHCEDDNIIQGAKRELLEETGFEAGNLVQIGEAYLNKGISPSKFYIVAAYNLRQVHENFDKIESISNVQFYTETEVLEMLYTGKIKDSHTVSACMLGFEHLRRNPWPTI